MTKATAVDLFQSALRANNAAIVDANGMFKVVPLDQAPVGATIRLAGIPPSAPLSDAAGGDNVGSGVKIVQLKYVAAAEMKGGLYTRQLDRDGRPLGDARLVLPSTELQFGKVASNGHGYVLISFGWNHTMTWMRLDAAGLPASAPHASALAVPSASPFVLTTSDGTYHAMYVDEATVVHDITIDENDHLAAHTLATIGYSSYTVVSGGQGNRHARESRPAARITAWRVPASVASTKN